MANVTCICDFCDFSLVSFEYEYEALLSVGFHPSAYWGHLSPLHVRKSGTKKEVSRWNWIVQFINLKIWWIFPSLSLSLSLSLSMVWVWLEPDGGWFHHIPGWTTETLELTHLHTDTHTHTHTITKWDKSNIFPGLI